MKEEVSPDNNNSNVKSRTTSLDVESLEEQDIKTNNKVYSSINKKRLPSTETYIDKQSNRFPYCIVWTPIPFITAILPFIGHTGICTSSGVIHDFSGPYTVSIDNMSFGSPCKYVQLTPTDHWDSAVDKGDIRYNTEKHNLCTNNCHSHCAYVLNIVQYNSKSNYTMIDIWWMITTKSVYLSWKHVLKTYAGFAIFLLVLLILFCIIK